MGIMLKKGNYTPVPKGLYRLQFVALRDVPDAPYGPALGWDFQIVSPDQYKGRRISDLTAAEIQPNNKTDKFIFALLGREMAPGEEINSDFFKDKLADAVLKIRIKKDGQQDNAIETMSPVSNFATPASQVGNVDVTITPAPVVQATPAPVVQATPAPVVQTGGVTLKKKLDF